MAEELPSFVVMTSQDRQGSCGQLFFDYYWGAGFLPGKYQGVPFRSAGDPVLYLSNPKGVSRAGRREMLDGLAELNHHAFKRYADPEIETRIAQYEMAFQMQASSRLPAPVCLPQGLVTSSTTKLISLRLSIKNKSNVFEILYMCQYATHKSNRSSFLVSVLAVVVALLHSPASAQEKLAPSKNICLNHDAIRLSFRRG